jgi:hypothetical protein
MSQQAAVGRSAGRSGRRGPRYFCPQGGGGEPTKGFRSAISEITHDTFNTGKNKFAAQFMQSRKNVANYLQHTASLEGYLVAEMVRTGKKQLIALPPAVNENVTNLDDQRIIRAEEVKMVAKRRLKLDDVLKKVYTTVYDQCSQEVKDKLEAADNWERNQQDQSLHKLIQKVKWICVGFDDHKQEVFNLVQALKTLFLYTQGEKDGVDQYGRNFMSLWDTVQAFGGLLGVHKGLIEAQVKNPSQVNNVNKVTPKECREAASEVALYPLLP